MFSNLQFFNLDDPKVINITFRRVVDYPLDLYYVMDLSNSMRDDLETLQVKLKQKSKSAFWKSFS